MNRKFWNHLEKTNRWVNEISDLPHWDDHHKAYHGLRAVLHVLRMLPVPEAASGAQLPCLCADSITTIGSRSHTKKIKTAQMMLCERISRRPKRQFNAID
jgi:uncharacterized protein (DUF2267 family)